MSVRVALVHDWLTGMRGGEKVLEVFANMFPDAPIYTLLHKKGSVSKAIEAHPIVTSLLQKLPKATTHYRYYLPLLPRLIESMRIEPCDLVVSTSHCVAKSAIAPRGARHASYVFSPMRYLYDRYEDYFSRDRAGWSTRAAMRIARNRLQRWDIATAHRPDDMVGISTFIADRIKKCYGRSCSVIHPPVDASRFAEAKREPEDYYLMVTALVPYKNVDLAVEAFRSIDRTLIVAGSGPMEERLRATAPPNVRFLGWVDDEEIPGLVAGCRAFLMPNVEDFGIAPVEAMAAGRPVIALGEGGVLDTVIDIDDWRKGQLKLPPELRYAAKRLQTPTGIYIRDASTASLAKAIHDFERDLSSFQPEGIAEWAREFDLTHFRRRIGQWLGVDESTSLSAA